MFPKIWRWVLLVSRVWRWTPLEYLRVLVTTVSELFRST
jgi:hypothetical protein